MPVRSAHVDIEFPLIDQWNYYMETPLSYPSDHPIFVDSVTNRSYSHADIKEKATEFGKALRHVFKWNKGDVLCFYTHNHIDYPLVNLGVMWAGGITSPANPTYTAEELGRQLKDSEARLLLTQKSTLETAVRAAALANLPVENIILMGDERDETGRHRHWTDLSAKGAYPQPQRPDIDPKRDLAYLVYSSGTTGLPKGVMLTHFNVVANAMQGVDSMTLLWDRDSQIGILPFFHIYGLNCVLHATFHSGAKCIVMARYDLEKMCQIIQDHVITFLYIAPPVILNLGKHPVVDKYDLSSLRWINSGAAPLGKELVQSVWNRLAVGVKQGYGLSETSPTIAAQLSDEFWKYQGSTGRILRNMVAKIVDEEGKEMQTGETGELLVKGPNVFSGYWKRPELNSETFTEDGWFKTGDVGHFDKKGNLYLSDRRKELIKYKGYQVAPAELEAKLLGHDDVTDVCVIGVWDEEQYTEIPRAYVVVKPGIELSPSKAKEIAEWLNAQVAPAKKLRGGLRFLDEIPKSQSGKILRRVLRDRVKAEESGPKAKL